MTIEQEKKITRLCSVITSIEAKNEILHKEILFLRTAKPSRDDYIKEANQAHLNAAIGVLKNVRCSDNKDRWGVTKREIGDICNLIKSISG